MEESYFDKIEKDIKKEHTFFVDFGLDFAKQVKYILSIHPKIKTQKALAEALGKNESEISRMLTGLHNLTLESVAKLCGVLDYDLILTDLKAQEKYNSAIQTPQEKPVIIYAITTNVFLVRTTITINQFDQLNGHMMSFPPRPIVIDSLETQMLT